MEEGQRNGEVSTGQPPLVRSGMSQGGVGRESGGEETPQKARTAGTPRAVSACSWLDKPVSP